MVVLALGLAAYLCGRLLRRLWRQHRQYRARQQIRRQFWGYE